MGLSLLGVIYSKGRRCQRAENNEQDWTVEKQLNYVGQESLTRQPQRPSSIQKSLHRKEGEGKAGIGRCIYYLLAY